MMKYLLLAGILLSVSALSAGDDTLERQYREFEKARNFPAMAETAKKILANASADAEKTSALNRLGALYMHSIRDIDTGKKYFLQLIGHLRTVAGKQTGAQRAATLEQIASVYLRQLRMKPEAAAAYKEAAALWRAERANASGRARVELTGKIRNASRNAKDAEGEAEAAKEFLAAWTAFLKENDALAYAQWRKAVGPDGAIRQLTGSPEERALAEKITKKVLSAPDASAADKIHACMSMRACALSGNDRETGFRYLELQAGFQPESGPVQLQYGEELFRWKHALAQARTVFEKVKSDTFDEKSRRMAELWLDMLSD